MAALGIRPIATWGARPVRRPRTVTQLDRSPRLATTEASFSPPGRRTSSAPSRSRPGWLPPNVHRHQRIDECPAYLREFVVHARRDGREDGSRHQPVPLQASQREREHALRDAFDGAAYLVEPHRAFGQKPYDKHRPFVADARKHRREQAAMVRVIAVTRYQICASLRDVSTVFNCAPVTKCDRSSIPVNAAAKGAEQ